MNLTENTRYCLGGIFFIIEKFKLMSVMTLQSITLHARNENYFSDNKDCKK